MYTIVALGNPGPEYHLTRHNVAWLVMNELLETWSLPLPERERGIAALKTHGTVWNQSVQIIFPQTFMNRSGETVAALAEREQLGTLIVVHDEIDLPLGNVVVAYDRGAAGHNGVRSIISALGHQQFLRVRIGIGQTGFWARWRRPRGDALSTFVLGKFTAREEAALRDVTPRVGEALRLLCTDGFAKAAQKINEQPASGG
jgi:PTH1 family peptidyl-tRNA hydrolase